MANLLGPTANLMSNLQIHSKQPAPEVGMAATICLYSDRNAATVAEVSADGSFILVREDRTRADKSKELGMGHQEWIHEPDPDGREYRFRLDPRTGKFRQVRTSQAGRLIWSKEGVGLILGRRDHYHDWSF